MTLLSGWGRYPELDAKVIMPASVSDALQGISSALPRGAMIARGLGRSYGDSSLAPTVLDTTRLDHFRAFDDSTGVLTCSAGVSIAEILNIFVPKGWFLPVTPGTKFVTVGGAIASDVHGKNHHLEGCFSDHVSALKLITISDGIVECSREVRPELFRASCGGMGLTGIIVAATFRLKPIQSAYIDETTIKARNIEEALGVFDAYSDAAYSVAWIDCLATGAALGRSLIMLGEHAPAGGYAAAAGGHLSMPVDMPSFILNRYSIRAFNALYYRRAIKPVATRVAHYESFFYPLDGIGHWNRMYGKNGFVQYQFVLPKAAGLEGLTTVLKRIAVSQRGSFLAVLKAFGKANANYLSFPVEGYTLALDFRRDAGLFDLLDRLDEVVLDYGGRIYLTKDARMSETMFKKSYPLWGEFMQVRTSYGADAVLHSLQSRRLGL